MLFSQNIYEIMTKSFAVRNLLKNEKKYYEEVLHSSRNNLMVIKFIILSIAYTYVNRYSFLNICTCKRIIVSGIVAFLIIKASAHNLSK